MLFLIMMAIPYIILSVGIYLILRYVEWERYSPSILLALFSLFASYIWLPAILSLTIPISNAPFNIGFLLANLFNNLLNHGNLTLLNVWILVIIWTLSVPISLELYPHFASPLVFQKSKEGMKRPLKHIFVIGLLLVGYFAPLTVYTSSTSSCYLEGLSNAQPLVDGLHDYYVRYGIYPSSLSELMPEFTDHVPDFCLGITCYREFSSSNISEVIRQQGNIDTYLLIWFFSSSEFTECFDTLP